MIYRKFEKMRRAFVSHGIQEGDGMSLHSINFISWLFDSIKWSWWYRIVCVVVDRFVNLLAPELFF
jgi:hypothetical protein